MACSSRGDEGSTKTPKAAASRAERAVGYSPMDGSAFAREVARLALGKRMPDGVYVHIEALPALPEEIRSAVDAARSLARLDESAFQVIKLALRGRKLSFLAYPRFFDEAFPTLTASWVVDLAAGTVTSRAYAAEGNPPILHRKELLLPLDHTLRGELAAEVERSSRCRSRTSLKWQEIPKSLAKG